MMNNKKQQVLIFLLSVFLIIFAATFVLSVDLQNAQELLQEAKALSSDGKHEEALKYFLMALQIEKKSGNKKNICYVLDYIGLTYSELGRYDKALEYALEELQIKEQIGDKEGIARSLNNIAFTYTNLGEYKKSLKYYTDELQIRKQLGIKIAIALNLSDISVVYERLGDYQKALDYALQELGVRKEINIKSRIGNTLNHIGSIYASLGDYENALKYFKEVLAVMEEAGDKAGKSRAFYYIGIVYGKFDDFGNAFEYLQKALQIQRQSSDKGALADTIYKIGDLYLGLGDYKKAVEYFTEALDISEETGDTEKIHDILDDIALAYAKLGDFQKAVEYIQEIVKIKKGAIPLSRLGNTYNNFAFIYLGSGHYKEALKYMQEVLSIQKKCANTSGEGVSLNNLGFIYFCMKDYKKSIECYRRALKTLQKIGDPSAISNALGGMGLAYKHMKEYDRAIEFLSKSIDVLESISGRMKIEEHKMSFLQSKIFLYEELIWLLIQKGKNEDAWIYVERAKARTFLDMLGNQKLNFKAKASPELVEKVAELEGKINNVMAMAANQKNNEALKQLYRQIDVLQEEYEEIIVKLKASNPEYASLKTVQVSSLKSIQGLLEEDSVLLEYFTSIHSSYLFIIDKKKLFVIKIPFSQDQLKEKVKELRDRIETRAVCDNQINLLSRILLPEEAQELIKLKKKLIIVPHSVLHYLPFCLLRDTDGEYLIKHYKILTEPSASVWKLCLEKPTEKKMSLAAYALGTAKVSFGEIARMGITPLPATKDEAETIVLLFPESILLIGEQMTYDRVIETVGKKSMIHFATHGLLDPDHPLFSGLVLSDRILTTAQIFSLDIRANIVVLSACNTATGKISQGDEITGISRAFMYAGAPIVVASLWSVSDESTAFLMKSFYNNINKGTSEAAALKEAQLKLMKEYPHPYFWAPFILIGDRSY